MMTYSMRFESLRFLSFSCSISVCDSFIILKLKEKLQDYYFWKKVFPQILKCDTKV